MTIRTQVYPPLIFISYFKHTLHTQLGPVINLYLLFLLGIVGVLLPLFITVIIASITLITMRGVPCTICQCYVLC